MIKSRTNKITKFDNGIRPAGKSDECFYCGQKINSEHTKECVIPEKIVEMEFRIKLPVYVPSAWDEEMINFKYNEGTWCANELFEMLKDACGKNPGTEIISTNSCLCPITKALFIQTLDDGPFIEQRNLNSIES